MLSYYVIYYEKFKKVMQRIEKVALTWKPRFGKYNSQHQIWAILSYRVKQELEGIGHLQTCLSHVF